MSFKISTPQQDKNLTKSTWVKWEEHIARKRENVWTYEIYDNLKERNYMHDLFSDQNCALLRCYPASIGNFLPTFRDIFKRLYSWLLKIEPIGLFEMSVKKNTNSRCVKCRRAQFSSATWQKIQITHRFR